DADLRHQWAATPLNALNRYGRMKKMNTKAGTVSARPPAYLKGRGELLSAWISAAGSVVLCWVRTAAPKTSFQERTKAKSAAAARPGTLLGRTTRTTAPSLLVPKIIAASSSSRGTRRKTLDESRTVKGRAIAVCRKATESTVSYRCSSMKLTARGMASTARGKARTFTSSSCARLRPVNE